MSFRLYELRSTEFTGEACKHCENTRAFYESGIFHATRRRLSLPLASIVYVPRKKQIIRVKRELKERWRDITYK